MKRKLALLLTFVLFMSSLILPCSSSLAAAKKPKLNMKKLNMTVGNSFRLRVYNLKKKQKVTYTSSNTSVAIIKNTATRGKRASIKAQGIGSATITATVRKKKKVIRRLKCRVKVSPNGVCLKFFKRTVHMKVDTRFRVEPIIKPNTSTEEPIYESNNPQVATINSRGVITALAPGTANITATLLSSNQKAVCTIIVSENSMTNARSNQKWKTKKSYSSEFTEAKSLN